MRALLVNARTGTKIAQAVHHYPHWKAGRYCQATKNQFRQHPLDFLEGPETTVRQVAQQVPAPTQVFGSSVCAVLAPVPRLWLQRQAFSCQIETNFLAATAAFHSASVKGISKVWESPCASNNNGPKYFLRA